MDSFKALLVKFEYKATLWRVFLLIALWVHFLRKIKLKIKA